LPHFHNYFRQDGDFVIKANRKSFANVLLVLAVEGGAIIIEHPVLVDRFL